MEWNALLAALDPNPGRAAEKYETARAGLIAIFRSRGLWNDAEALADQTLDVSARRLVEKASTTEPIQNILSYMRVVARKIASERHRLPGHIPLEESAEPSNPPEPPDEEKAEMDEHKLSCLRTLVEQLPVRDRTIILEYYRLSKSAKIENRARLAAASDRSIGALRVRVYRIRRLLEKKLLECLSAGGSSPKNVGVPTGGGS